MRKLTTDEIATHRRSAEDLESTERLPVIAVLEDVRSLYNVGSMFRTADAVFLQKLMLTGYTPSPPRKEIEKTALGATRTIPWESHETSAVILNKLRNEGWTICAVESTDASIDLHAIETIPTPLVLVFGNEITGVRQETLSLCHQAWEIPMFGTKHSLNVSVAFGVVAYEVCRRLADPTGRKTW